MFEPLFEALETNAFSVWMRESPSILAFPAILAAHTIGLAFVAGLNAALDLRLLGVARGVPLAIFTRFLPFMWAGFWINAASGAALLLAYPTKALTNPVFYLKLGLIATALALLPPILRRVVVAGGTAAPPDSVSGRADRWCRAMAVASLLAWAGATVAGRLLAYTCTRLTIDSRC